MSETPMERQWNALKKEAGDNILFFRLGDFYEMFHEDAIIASEILEISLTTRNKKSENQTKMCGFPIKAAEKYIAKLTRAGKKVAIAEQVSDPKEKGIVERKIVRIVTPGTTFSDYILEAGKSNFIASLYSDEKTVAVSFAELSTGECFVQEFNSINEASKEITMREVSEVLLCPDQFKEHSHAFNYFSGSLSRHFLPDDPELFCINFFKVQTLKAFGIENKPLCISSVALLCSFLEETQKTNLSHISGVAYKTTKNILSLDNDTIRNLELFYSTDGDKKNGLHKNINYTKTAMGSRHLQERMLQPFGTKPPIEKSNAQIESLLNNSQLLNSLKNSFSQISDLERIIGKISTNRANPSDYVLLQKSLEEIETLKNKMENTFVQNNKTDEEWKNWKRKLEEELERKY